MSHEKLSTQAYISAKDSLGHVCDKGGVTGIGEMERKLLGHPYVDSWTEFSPEWLRMQNLEEMVWQDRKASCVHLSRES